MFAEIQEKKRRGSLFNLGALEDQMPKCITWGLSIFIHIAV